LAADATVWPDYLATLNTMISVLAQLRPEACGGLLTTKEMAERLGMNPKTPQAQGCPGGEAGHAAREAHSVEGRRDGPMSAYSPGRAVGKTMPKPPCGLCFHCRFQIALILPWNRCS